MSEIAELAEVSKATVSRALHRPDLLKEATRQRILKVIEENKYVYNQNAADFSKKQTSTIGLIIPTLKSSIHAETIRGIQQEAHRHNLASLIANSDYSTEDEVGFMNLFRQRRLAGIILTGVTDSTLGLVKEFSRSGIPCVVIWEIVEDPEVSFVAFDNRVAAYSMTRYLLELGHRRIGLITGLLEKVRRASMRHQGYVDALKEYGIVPDPSLVVGAEPALENGMIAAKRLLALPDPPSAIFATSDTMAFGALRAIKVDGLRVPEDISLAGFDDIDLASYSDPPLTTIRVPEYEMGRLAVRSLLALIRDPSGGSQQHTLETRLIVRDSCRSFSSSSSLQ